MQKSTEVCLSAWAFACVVLGPSLTACTIQETPAPQTATAYPAPAPAPVPVAASPAPATYRPVAEAPPAYGPASQNGVAVAPPATNVATAPAVAPPASGYASGYADDPATTVSGAPPAPRPDLMVASPGPGYAWVSGHWAWRGSWVWVGGGWKPIPEGRRQWVSGSWIAQGSSSRWEPGHWI